MDNQENTTIADQTIGAVADQTLSTTEPADATERHNQIVGKVSQTHFELVKHVMEVVKNITNNDVRLINSVLHEAGLYAELNFKIWFDNLKMTAEAAARDAVSEVEKVEEKVAGKTE